MDNFLAKSMLSQLINMHKCVHSSHPPFFLLFILAITTGSFTHLRNIVLFLKKLFTHIIWGMMFIHIESISLYAHFNVQAGSPESWAWTLWAHWTNCSSCTCQAITSLYPNLSYSSSPTRAFPWAGFHSPQLHVEPRRSSLIRLGKMLQSQLGK